MSWKWTMMMLRERIDIIEKAEQWRQISLRIWTSWNPCWRQCWNHQESEAKLPRTSRSPSAHGCGTRSIQDKDIHAGHDAVVVNLWEAVSEDMVANLFKQGDFRQAGASASSVIPLPMDNIHGNPVRPWNTHLSVLHHLFHKWYDLFPFHFLTRFLVHVCLRPTSHLAT